MAFRIFTLTLLIIIPFVGVTQLSEQQKERLREELTERINAQRVKRRLDPLILNDTLRQAAQFHTDYMASKNILSHKERSAEYSVPKKRVHAFQGEDFELVGENILYVYVEDFSLTEEDIERIADQMFKLWKDSNLHYKNMMDRNYQFADLGFESNEKKQRIYATQVFGSK